MTDNKRIGRRLEAIRKALGFDSQEEFALEIGLDKSTYSSLKTGTRRLSLDTALLLRNQYRIPLDYLYFGDALEALPSNLADALKRAA
jgi:transcriptional regulator with XRE-family HTH domain